MIDFVVTHWTELLPGARETLLATAVTLPLFLVFGLVLALLRMSGPTPLRLASAVVVEAVRGTPLIVQLFWVFYALPFVGIVLPTLAAGVLALTLNFGAYGSEIYRAGIQSVPRGQSEAAAVLGMPRRTAFRRVVLPQALVIAFPALGNQVIELFKATSLLSLIAAADIVLMGRRLIVETQNATAVWLLVGFFYFALCFPASLALSSLQRRLYRPQTR